MSISRAEFNMMVERMNRQKAVKEPLQHGPPPCDDEAELQQQIADYCRSNGWPCNHSRMDKRSTSVLGWPDFTILLPERVDQMALEYGSHSMLAAKVLFVECKKKGGKLSLEQNAMSHWFERVGHKMHVVYSFEEFLKLI